MSEPPDIRLLASALEYIYREPAESEARELLRCGPDYDPTTGLTPFQLHLQKRGYGAFVSKPPIKRPPQGVRSAAQTRALARAYFGA